VWYVLLYRLELDEPTSAGEERLVVALHLDVEHLSISLAECSEEIWLQNSGVQVVCKGYTHKVWNVFMREKGGKSAWRYQQSKRSSSIKEIC